MTTVEILGTRVSRMGMTQALASCSARAHAGKGGYVCFANVHSVTEASRRPEVRAALNGSAFTFADGVPLLWVSKARNAPVESRVSGPDFMARFLKQERALYHGFVGGEISQAQAIAQRFELPKFAAYSPPRREFSAAAVQEDVQALLDRGAASGMGRAPEVIWVALGAPKQELWMQEASKRLPHSLLLGIGAALDFLSGTQSRAPEWMQQAGLEWSYRLMQEPSRLWKRYLTTNSTFAVKAAAQVVQERLAGKRGGRGDDR